MFSKNAAKEILGPRVFAALRGGYHYFKFWQSLIKQRGPNSTIFDVLLYCEQPGHWQTVSGLVSTLIKKQENIKICLVISYKINEYEEAQYPTGITLLQFAPHLMRFVKSAVVCTPYVGFQRNWLFDENTPVVHLLVSLTSLDGVYRDDMFDGYDYILCAGPHHIEDFKALVKKRPITRRKVLIPAGYPKLDLSIEWAQGSKGLRSNYLPTVLYAPTHVYMINEKLASLRNHGLAIVRKLIEGGYRVIFRPHPVSFKDQDKRLVENICSEFSGNPRFTLDRSKEYKASYSNADIMITDLSGTGFTFSLSFCKPTIFFSPNIEVESGMRGIQFEDRERIGAVARNLDELMRQVDKFCLIDISDRILRYRDQRYFNVGTSVQYIAECIFCILAKKEKQEWVLT